MVNSPILFTRLTKDEQMVIMEPVEVLQQDTNDELIAKLSEYIPQDSKLELNGN